MQDDAFAEQVEAGAAVQLDAGQAEVLHETAESVLRNLRITGVRLTGSELKDASVHFTLASSG